MPANSGGLRTHNAEKPADRDQAANGPFRVAGVIGGKRSRLHGVNAAGAGSFTVTVAIPIFGVDGAPDRMKPGTSMSLFVRCNFVEATFGREACQAEGG